MKVLFKNSAVFFIAISIFAMFTNFIGNVGLILILLLTDLSIIHRDGIRLFKKKSYFFLSLFYIVVIFYSLLGYGSLNPTTFKGWIFGCILLISTFIISDHIRKLDSKQISSLLTLSLISFCICAFITLYISISNPMAVRMFGMGEIAGSGASEANIYRSMGMMSYASAHAIAILAVGVSMLLCYSSKKMVKVAAISLLVLMLALQFIMTITTALLVSAVCSLLIVINKLSNGRVVISVLFIFLVLLIISSTGVIYSLLDFASSSNKEIFAKLNDLFFSIETGSGSGQMGYRESLYTVSSNSFLSNPLLGLAIDDGSRTQIGQHSFILDSLAFYGMFAFLYFMAWWKQYCYVLDVKRSHNKMLYYLAIVPVVLLITLKAESVAEKLPFVSLVFIQLVFRYLRYKGAIKL